MKKPRLSIVGICQNEEKDLPGFIQHLLPWVDEIILVDSGSTDQTANIAHQYPDKVRFFAKPMNSSDGYGGQRTFGVQKARSKWVLNMDIDERVPPELAKEILGKIQNSPLNAYRYRRLNFFAHRPMKAGGWTSWNNPQLAKKNKHFYQGRLHEKAIIDGGESMIGQLYQPMWHLNDDGYRERMRKSFKYAQMEAEFLIQRQYTVKPYQLLLKPILEFIKKYIYKQGFRDGTPGLLAALHSADSIFRTYATAWDEQNRIPRSALEQQIQELWNDNQSFWNE